MSLRTVALETPRLWRSTSVLEPMGSFVETKSATMARSTSKRRSSALPIRHLQFHRHFTVTMDSGGRQTSFGSIWWSDASANAESTR